jgi:hypothetical protein
VNKVFLIILILSVISGCTSKATETKLPINDELKSFVVKQSNMISDAVMNDHGVEAGSISEIIKFVQYNSPKVKELNRTEKAMMDGFLTYSSMCMNVSGADKLDIVGCIKKKKELDDIVK